MISPHKGQWRGALMFSLICTLNKRLSKQSWGWWFETPSRSPWRRCNVYFELMQKTLLLEVYQFIQCWHECMYVIFFVRIEKEIFALFSLFKSYTRYICAPPFHTCCCDLLCIPVNIYAVFLLQCSGFVWLLFVDRNIIDMHLVWVQLCVFVF